METACHDEQFGHRNRVSAVCCCILSTGAVVLLCRIAPGGLSPASDSDDLSLLQARMISKRQTEVNNLAGIVRHRLQRPGFGPGFLSGGQHAAQSSQSVSRLIHLRNMQLHGYLAVKQVHEPTLLVARGRTIACGLDLPVSASGSPISAEELGSKQLVRLLTWASAKIVMAEMDGLGNEGDVSLAPHAQRIKENQDYAALVTLMEDIPLVDADEWMREGMRLSPKVAMRLLEVRKRCASELDYGLLSELTQERVMRANTDLMVENVRATSGSDNDMPKPLEEYCWKLG